MIEAWKRHKLERVLAPHTAAEGGSDGAPGVAGRARRAALLRSEDLLTSTALGALAVAPAALSWAVLQHGAEPLAGAAWPDEAPAGAPDWEFWPRMPPDPRDGGEWVEPDVVLRWGERVIVFEAKHHGAQRAGQWIRQCRAVLAREGVAAARLAFVSLGGTQPAADHALAAALRAAEDLGDVSVHRLEWRRLNRALSTARPAALDPGLARLLDDAQAFLDAAGHHDRRGLWTLPAAVRAIGAAPATLPRAEGVQ